MHKRLCCYQFVKALTGRIHTTTIPLRCRLAGSIVPEALEDEKDGLAPSGGGGEVRRATGSADVRC
jgi:hypothetical protein